MSRRFEDEKGKLWEAQPRGVESQYRPGEVPRKLITYTSVENRSESKVGTLSIDLDAASDNQLRESLRSAI